MKKIIFLTLLAIVGTFYSCSDSWFELKPKGKASATQFYNEKGISALLIGAYAALDGAGTDAGKMFPGVEGGFFGRVFGRGLLGRLVALAPMPDGVVLMHGPVL